jgi:hypothetical protein
LVSSIGRSNATGATPAIAHSQPVHVPSDYPAGPAAEAAEIEDQGFNIDWGTTGLALATIVAVGGLIPFWLWIWFTFNPPTP